ncbi:MAG: electron transport complex subunit RsxC [Clostridia bacterium]|nr:electron transport complex subunit RsxC [Clostridia bacterium]
MAFSLHGVKTPHKKGTAGMLPVVMTVPATVTIPMNMHIGKPATPVVKAGDAVCVGTLIGEQNGYVSSPVYSSVSGTVKEICEKVQFDGKKGTVIVIESDGLQTVENGIKAPVVTNREELLAAIAKSGIVGLGGAGFPTHVKFAAEPEKIEELIINGAECEPYITSDTVTMTERADDMAYAIKVLKEILGIKKVIIGIENNKKAAIEKMKELAAKDECVTVKVLPSLYPQGGEKVLIYNTTGKVVETGKLPIDAGCIVCNCTTLASVGEYLKTGMPLVKKCITIDGGAVNEPKNIIAPIGTSIEDVFEFCGGLKENPGKVLYGGPMMGIAVSDLTAPVIKNTNAIIALTEKESVYPKETACIRCGACQNNCPFGINAASVAKAYKEKDFEDLTALGTDTCMLCGCCSFVCPAARPLTQNMRLAKATLAAYRASKKEEEGKK